MQITIHEQRITYNGDIDLYISPFDFLDMFENGWVPDWVSCLYSVGTDEEGLTQVICLLNDVPELTESGGVAALCGEESKDDQLDLTRDDVV
jgi:hypothetical protein